MSPNTSRREFLITSAPAAPALAAPAGVPAAGGERLRVGLIGCGSRGTGAAKNTLTADKNVKLVALGDAFEDRLEQSLASILKEPTVAAQVDVKPEAKFVGFGAFV